MSEQPITALFTDAGVVTREDLQEMTKGSQELLVKSARTWKELRALVTELRGEVIAYVRLYRETKQGLSLTENELTKTIRDLDELSHIRNGELTEWEKDATELKRARIELDGVKKALDIATTENVKLMLSTTSERFIWFPVALVAGLIGWFLGRMI